MGVPVEEIGHLLSFWRDRDRPGREAEAIAQEHFADLNARISEMQAMAGALRNLVKSCAGDDRPDCPILSDLGDQAIEPIVRPVVGSTRSTRRLAQSFGAGGALRPGTILGLLFRPARDPDTVSRLSENVLAGVCGQPSVDDRDLTVLGGDDPLGKRLGFAVLALRQLDARHGDGG